MKKRSLFLILITFVFLSQTAFAKVEFVSPISGTWGNKQMLIIDNVQDGEYYYSIDGSDPEKFGFAYDGPVFLDISGDIELRVTYFSPDGKKDSGYVSYSVVPDRALDKSYRDFLFTFFDVGYYDYNMLGALDIPPSLTFTLEQEPNNFIPGVKLSLEEDSVLSHFVPCCIYDSFNNVKWRFFIKAEPETAGIFSRREMPFTVTDWDTITFNDDDFIYKVDEGYWGQPTEFVKLDRSVSHVIYWQSINYKIGNTIESEVLPPKPEIKYEKRDDGSGYFYLDGDDSYMLGIMTEDDGATELFSEIGVDVFYGDKASGSLSLGVFSDSIYQGQIEVYYELDKLPPKSPIVTSSAKTFYSRNSVELNISVSDDIGYGIMPDSIGGTSDNENIEDKVQLYIAVGEPYTIENSNIVYKASSPIFYNVPTSDFSLYESGSYDTTLEAQDDQVIYYRILAYCQKGNMKSAVTEYSVIVDKSSYHFNKDSESSLGEGTLLNPFTTFDQCLEAFQDIRSVSLRVKGDLYIDKKYKVNSNLEIINGGDARIIFGPEGSIVLDGSSLEIKDCRMHKIPSDNYNLILPFFRINHSTLEIIDCQISGEFSKNAAIIDSTNSIITVDNSMISISADSYASFVSSINSKLSLLNSSVSVTGDTCVIVSASGGDLNINGNKLSIMGNIGRIAELFGVNAKIENNEFRADLNNYSKNITPIFANKKTKLIEKENSQIGF